MSIMVCCNSAVQPVLVGSSSCRFRDSFILGRCPPAVNPTGEALLLFLFNVDNKDLSYPFSLFFFGFTGFLYTQSRMCTSPPFCSLQHNPSRLCYCCYEFSRTPLLASAIESVPCFTLMRVSLQFCHPSNKKTASFLPLPSLLPLVRSLFTFLLSRLLRHWTPYCILFIS